MTEVRYLPRARSDVLGAVEFYESMAAGLGAEFLSTLEHTIDGIIAAPHAGSPYEGGTRRVVLGRFPFSFVYEHTRQRLLVVAWHNRLSDAAPELGQGGPMESVKPLG